MNWARRKHRCSTQATDAGSSSGGIPGAQNVRESCRWSAGECAWRCSSGALVERQAVTASTATPGGSSWEEARRFARAMAVRVVARTKRLEMSRATPYCKMRGSQSCRRKANVPVVGIDDSRPHDKKCGRYFPSFGNGKEKVSSRLYLEGGAGTRSLTESGKLAVGKMQVRR